MQVVVIANDALRQELLACPPADALTLYFIQHPSEYPEGLNADACIDLLFECKPERVNALRDFAVPLIVVNAVNCTIGDIGAPFVRINGWPGFLNRPLVEAAADQSQRSAAEKLFALLGRTTEWVPDIHGFITARIVAAIINEAFFALEENISTEQEIDTAMKLGTNYPFGPFEWVEKIGASPVYALLAGLARRESRYLPCKLLEKKALA